MEIAPTLCPCLQASPDLAHAGLSENGTPVWLCAECLTTRCIELLQSGMTPLDVAKLVHVEPEYLEPITLAMHRARVVLRECDSRLSNRINMTKQHIWKQATKQEIFVPQPYGVSDGIPSYQRRLKHFKRAHEPRALSSFSDAIAFNKKVTA